MVLWIFHSLMRPIDAVGMANSVDPDQTAFKLSVQTCLSEKYYYGIHIQIF